MAMADQRPIAKPGKLYLCATPIGNLKDITIRVLDTLATADLIAAEDTRHTRKLLTHYKISKRLVSFHDQNESKMLPRLIEELRSGKVIAQVSDAGLPGIADPGHRLVKACVANDIEVEVLPGASASLTAAVLSAFPIDDIRFLGYLPKKSGARRSLLEEVGGGRSTMVFYESPHRLVGALTDVDSVLGERQVFVARELTKIHEEHLRGTAAALLAQLEDRLQIKGEVVLVVSPERERAVADMEQVVAEVLEEVSKGKAKSEAARVVAARHGLSRRLVYEAAHD